MVDWPGFVPTTFGSRRLKLRFSQLRSNPCVNSIDVDWPGFEPGASSLRTRRSTELNYQPTETAEPRTLLKRCCAQRGAKKELAC